MWWLKALAIWFLLSLALTGLIGRFLSGDYFKSQSKPPPAPDADGPKP